MTDFNERIERLAELGPLSKLIYHDNEKDLAIATADGSNALGYFVPRHGYANEQIAQVIDSYNEALPLLRDMAQALSEAQAENERLRDENEELSDRVEVALEVMYKDDSNYFTTVIAAKYILENGLKEVEALHDA